MAASVYAALDLRTVYATAVAVTGVEKRDIGCVYSMTVTWSNRNSYIIYRTYADIIQLKRMLEQLFQEAACQIPRIPAIDSVRKVFGLFNESAYHQRQELVDELCKAVVALPSEVSHARFVTDFFASKPGDTKYTYTEELRSGPASLHPMNEVKSQELRECKVIVEFKAENTKQLDLEVGEVVILLREESSGWAFVGKPDFDKKEGKVGWVPRDFLVDAEAMVESCIDSSLDYAVFLPPDLREDSSDLAEQYLALASYSVDDDDVSKLPFEAGKKLSIFEKAEDGWWLAELNGKCGWVPSTYLIRLEAGSEEQDTCLITPETYTVVEEYCALEHDEISLPAAATVQVFMKPLSGWWQVKYEGELGLAPATKLQTISKPSFSRHRSTFRSPPRRSNVVANATVRKNREGPQKLSSLSNSTAVAEQPRSLDLQSPLARNYALRNTTAECTHQPVVNGETSSSNEPSLLSPSMSGSYAVPQSSLNYSTRMQQRSIHNSPDMIYALLKKAGKVSEVPLSKPPGAKDHTVPQNRFSTVMEQSSCSSATLPVSSRSGSNKVIRPPARATEGILRADVQEADNEVPRYTMRELMKVINEKNQLKLRLYSIFEELEIFKEIVRENNLSHASGLNN